MEHALSNLFESSTDHMAWSAYHASESHATSLPIVQTGLLPVFKEKSTDISTLKHCIEVITKTTSYLNPLQPQVIVADCPIYAMLKQIQ